jgi:hypothetical protein
VLGVSHTEVFRSIWRVVDSVLACEQLAFEFLSDHGKQKALAAAFQRKNQPQFDCCVAAIDGMLLWTEKPSPGECEKEQDAVQNNSFVAGSTSADLTCKGRAIASVASLMSASSIQLLHPTSYPSLHRHCTESLNKRTSWPPRLVFSEMLHTQTVGILPHHTRMSHQVQKTITTSTD